MSLLVATLRWLLPLALVAGLPPWLRVSVLLLGAALGCILLHASVSTDSACGFCMLYSLALGLAATKLLEAPFCALAHRAPPTPTTLAWCACLAATTLFWLRDTCGCLASTSTKGVCTPAGVWEGQAQALEKEDYVFWKLLSYAVCAGYERSCAVACQLAA